MRLRPQPPALNTRYLALKRAMDVVGAFFGMLVLLPVLPFLALLIKLDSRGPVFFRQLRIGKDGRLFNIYKFRTMAHGSRRC